MREFLKEIFTLRTVYVDRGAGRWAIKKRLHPFIRFTLSCLFLVLCAGIYVSAGTVQTRDAEAITQAPKEIKETVVAKLPDTEPVKVTLPPVKEIDTPKETPVAVKKSELKSDPFIIPLKKTAKKTEIILPSESNPGTDRIIAPKKAAAKSDKYRIVINKTDHTLTLLKGNDLIKTYGVAVGRNIGDKERVGDNRTPVGKFKIVSIENASSWTHDFRDGKGKISGAYGPWFMRLDAKGWKGIGIHGTHDPNSIGTNATEGCIRLNNLDLQELKENYAYRNMPVEIREN